MKREASGWVVDRVLDSRTDAWIFPEAFVFDEQRRRAKSTMGDMRTLATAVESYSIDNNQYPVACDARELEAILEPTYVRHVPLRDGWGEALLYVSTTSEYCVVSAGADRKLERPASLQGDEAMLARASQAPSRDAASDIVFCTGSFTRWFE